MKKALATLLMLLTLCSALPVLAESSADATWGFAVPISAVMSEYVRLVNREVLLEEDYVPDDLVYVDQRLLATSSKVMLREQCYNAMLRMFDGAKEAGINLYVRSGYRSYGTQKKNYEGRLERNNGKDDGFVAPPGASEHQTGLACDLTDDEYRWQSKLQQDFENTTAAAWLKENAADYGFILRYMHDKEDVTKTAYEPWHFRYVGVSAAQFIMRRWLSLEEFTDEWNFALAEFQGNGGDVDSALQEEQDRKINGPQVTYTEDYGENGEPEVSIIF